MRKIKQDIFKVTINNGDNVTTRFVDVTGFLRLFTCKPGHGSPELIRLTNMGTNEPLQKSSYTPSMQQSSVPSITEIPEKSSNVADNGSPEFLRNNF